MTWQEELSQLDGALASGQISADDYRRERERILAMATGGTPQGGTPQGGAPQGGAQQTPPSPGQGSGPVNRGQDAFPPPFKWTTERPSEPPPAQPPQQQGGDDVTQAVPSASNAEKTQIVSNSTDSTQIVDMNDTASKGPGPSFGDRTQYVPQVPPSPPQGMPAQQWQQQQGQHQGQQGPPPQGTWGPQQSTPPWEEQEELVPPWAGYQAQGAEVFDTDKPPGRGKAWAIVGVVVLLLVIAGGVLFLTVFKKDDTSAQPGGPQPTETSEKPSPPTSEEPEPFGPLYVPEGTTSGGKTYSAAELAKSKALPTPDKVLLKQAGISEARSVVVVNESTTISLWSFGTNDPPQLAEDITTDQRRFGYKQVKGGAVEGVKVYTSTQESSSRTVYVYRAHYTNGDDVIRVEAFATGKDQAKTQFDAVLEAQLELTPPE